MWLGAVGDEINGSAREAPQSVKDWAVHVLLLLADDLSSIL